MEIIGITGVNHFAELACGITDGYSFEKLVLGCSSREICNVVSSFFRHVTFKRAVKIVKDIQNQIGNWNPKKPSTEVAKELFDKVSEKVSEKFPEGRMRLYSSVGTFLDYKHGADFFFAFTSKNLREVIVTVDLTISSRKIKRKKSRADIILTLNDMRNGNYIKVVDMIALALIDRTTWQMGNSLKYRQ